MAHTNPNNPTQDRPGVGTRAGWLRREPPIRQKLVSRFNLSMVLPVSSSTPKVQRIFIALCGAGCCRPLPKRFPGSSVERVEKGLLISTKRVSSTNSVTSAAASSMVQE